MDIQLLQEIVILSILLFFSALFSASETALVSLDAIKIKRMQKHSRETCYALSLLADPGRLLSTILVGNMLVNITLSTILTSVLLKTFGDQGLSLAVGIATVLLLIFGEITPKTLAIKQPEEFACYLSRSLEYFARAIFPVRFFFYTISYWFIKRFGIQLEQQGSFTSDELKSIIEVSHRHGVVKANEKEMIRSVLELTQTRTQEIMTARPDIQALSIESTREQVNDFLKRVKHAKVPVYRNSLDEITGILYAKEFFFDASKDLKSLVRPVMFIPGTKRIDELLKDFQTQNTKVAIVVDEYGTTYGLVTLEDILEEVVGEVYDEYETKEHFIEFLGNEKFRVSGKAPIYLVNEQVHTAIPDGDYDTIAGYMLFVFGRIPKEGERMAKENFSFIIEAFAGRRIKSIIIQKL